MALSFDLHAAGALAPGIASLDDLLALAGASSPDAATSRPTDLPSPTSLQPNERRRASAVVRLALACAEQALATGPFPSEDLRLVFASDEGTGDVCGQMLEVLSTTRQVSPLLFHNSVHNAPSGYLSIGHRNRQSATSISLGQESFASGLLCAASEALGSRQPVLFMSYDSPLREPLQSLLPIEFATATAWIIAPTHFAPLAQPPLATFELSLRTSGTCSPLPGWLPHAWSCNSSAQSLAALAMLREESPRHDHCVYRDFSLGAQVLRLECRRGAAPC